MPTKAPSPLLKKGLFVRKPLSNFILRLLNWVFFFKKEKAPLPKHPKKILLCNIANFGDVVISTTVLPVLKKAFPHTEIGFLTSSPSSVALKNHPLVDHVHTFDHWYLNQVSNGKSHPLIAKCKAALHHRKKQKIATSQIRSIGYDLAIDLYSYYPNAIPLLQKSGIPVRIGYPTGGFSNLLTHPIGWHHENGYVGLAHLSLLKILGIDLEKASCLPSYSFATSQKDHLVIHMCSSSKAKEWDEDRWIELIHRLKKYSLEIYLTGKGEREAEICRFVANKTGVTNVCNQLSWKEFVLKVQEAKLLITVDSVSLHIAAASQTPTIALFTGISPPQMWTPPYAACKRIMKEVPCAPCLKKHGCEKRSCIQEIGVEEVFNEASILLEYLSVKNLIYPQNSPM